MTLKEKFARRFGEYWLDDKERYKFLNIPDIPILFGIDGGIICIPEKEEVCNIGVVGHRGTGKSLLSHRIVDEKFWLSNDNLIIMNDSLEESFDWCKPQNNNEWINMLKDINEVPCSLPIVYLYPNSSTLTINRKDINYVKISVPFSELIENNEEYMDLGGSAIYFRSLKKDLLECRSVDEVYEVINNSEKVSKASKNKILTAFDNIFKEGILNITDIEVPDELSLNMEYTANPFSVILKAGCIPSFITSDLYTRRYKAQIFAYHINLLFLNQLSKEFQGKSLYIYFDEITKICSTDLGDNPARRALENIPSRGRNLNLGLIYCTQNYEKVPRVIQSNTDYIFALRHSNKKEVKTICNDFDVTPSIEKMILNLKKFECVCLTTDYFTIYYNSGEIKKVEGPIIGRIIPCLSRHRKPK